MIARRISPKVVLILCLFGLTLASGLVPTDAHAQLAMVPQGTCTNDPQFNPEIPTDGTGIVSTITGLVRATMTGMTQSFFAWINSGIARTISIALTVYIIVEGIMFTMGMIKLTFFDFMMRMFKFVIIAVLLSPTAWFWFDTIVVKFFNDGTDSLIAHVTQYTIGGISNEFDPKAASGAATANPFWVVDYTIAKAFSAKMAVTVVATLFTGIYGIAFAGLLLMSLWMFLGAVLNAVWVYMMALVLKTLLLGLAPIFLCCLLFKQTRHMFDGWLGQLINASLQPVMLFIFFAFFCALIELCLRHILQTPVCWTEAQESLRGSPLRMHFWRFEILDTNTGTYEPYGGTWSFMGPDDLAAPGAKKPAFPIDMITVLFFLLFADLTSRFNRVVGMIANDLAGASTNFSNFEMPFSDMFKPNNNRQAQKVANVRGMNRSGVRGGGAAGGMRRGAQYQLQQIKDDIANKGIVETMRGSIADLGSER